MNKRLDLIEKWVNDGTLENNLAIMQSMSMQGMTLEQIGAKFGITERHLCNLKNKHSSVNSAIKNGRESVVAMCQNKLIELIQSGDVTATIYALKIYGGEFFNDRKFTQLKAEISGKDGKPIEIESQVMIYLPEKEEL